MPKDLDQGTATSGAVLLQEPSGSYSNPPPVRITVIEPAQGWVPRKLSELSEYREVLYFFILRDIKVRYRQTLIGAAWAIIQPLAIMVVFAVFFGRVARMPSDGLPYPLFAFPVLVPWTFFARALAQSSESLVANQHLITKVYIPRLLLPSVVCLILGCPSSSCWVWSGGTSTFHGSLHWSGFPRSFCWPWRPPSASVSGFPL